MFVIPVIGSAGWRNPPVITIGLIVINCLVYFFFQYDDDRLYSSAMKYYLDSGLEQIELTAYMEHLRAG